MQTDCGTFMLMNEHCNLCEQVKELQTFNVRCLSSSLCSLEAVQPETHSSDATRGTGSPHQ